jgi:hypothetical protein
MQGRENEPPTWCNLQEGHQELRAGDAPVKCLEHPGSSVSTASELSGPRAQLAQAKGGVVKKRALPNPDPLPHITHRRANNEKGENCSVITSEPATSYWLAEKLANAGRHAAGRRQKNQISEARGLFIPYPGMGLSVMAKCGYA